MTRTQVAIVDDPGGGKREILSTRPWELLGFGCHYAWLLSIAFGTTMYVRFESVELIMTLRLLIFVCLAIMFAALFLAQRFTPRFALGRRVVIVAGFVGMVGTWLLLVPDSGMASWIVWVVGALAVGFSNSVSMTAGNRLWANNRPEYGMLQLAVSTVLAVALFYVLLALPFEAAVPVIAALPLVGDVILALTKGGKHRGPAYRKYEGVEMRYDRRLLAYALAFALSTGGMLASLLADDAAALAAGSGAIMAGSLVAALFTLMVALRKKPAGMLKSVDRPVSALFVIGLAGLLLEANGSSWQAGLAHVFQALVMAGFVLSDQFLWLINPDMVFRTQKPSAMVLARSCAFEWAGLAAGFFLGCAAQGCWGWRWGVGLPWVLFGCLGAYILVRTFALGHSDAVKLAEARISPAGEDELAEHCQVLAEQYGLSPRETEVFLLLARGRSGPFIQEELTLSQSTIKTHTRNLYRKFDVTNKQELLDLVGRDL